KPMPFLAAGMSGPVRAPGGHGRGRPSRPGCQDESITGARPVSPPPRAGRGIVPPLSPHAVMRKVGFFLRNFCTGVDKKSISRLNPRTDPLTVHVDREGSESFSNGR